MTNKATATAPASCGCSLSDNDHHHHEEKKDQNKEEEERRQHRAEVNQHHHHHHAEEADVRQARKGLLKLMLEHSNVMPKFSSTPVLLRDDDDDDDDQNNNNNNTQHHHHHHIHHAVHRHSNNNAPSSSSITPSERAYLESLLQSGDVHCLKAASDRLQDITLFPKQQQQQADPPTSTPLDDILPGDDETATQQQNQKKQPARRRDSKVQQELFKLHEQGGVHERPSVVLQRMHDRWLHHSGTTSNSLLVGGDESSLSLDGDGNNNNNNNNNNSILLDSNPTTNNSTSAASSCEATNSSQVVNSSKRLLVTNRRYHQQLQHRSNSILECPNNNSILESGTATTMDGLVDDDAAATAAVISGGEEAAAASGEHDVDDDDDDDDFTVEDEEGFGSKGIGMGLFANAAATSRQKVASRPIYYRKQNSILEQADGDADATVTTSSVASATAAAAKTDTAKDENDNHDDAATCTSIAAVLAPPASCPPTQGTSDNVAATETTERAEAVVGTTTATGSASSGTFRILGTFADDVSCHPHVLSPPLMESLLAFIPESMADYNYFLKYSLVRDGGGIATLLRHARASNTTILAIETTNGHVFGCFTTSGWRLSRGWYGSSEAFLWKMRRSRRLEETTTTTRRRSSSSSSMVQQAMQESEIQVFPHRPGNVAIQYCSSEAIMLGQGELLNTAVAHATPAAVAAISAAAGAVSATKTSEHASSSSSSGHSPVRKSDERGTHTASTTGHGTSKHYGQGLYLRADLLRGSTSTSETFGNPCLVNDTLRGARFEVENLEVWTLTPHDNVEQAQESELSCLFLEGDYPKKDLNLLGILVGGSIS